MRLFLAIAILLVTAIAITLLYHQTQQADINYYEGHRYFEKGEYEEAMKFCEKTLAINPSHEGALIDLAYSCQWTGDFKRAIETFKQVLSINPEDYKIMMALAETLAWNKEYEKSIAVCEKIINSTGGIKAQILLGQVCIWSKQFDSAKEVLEEVLRKEPDNSQAKLLYAKALHYSGEAKKSIEIYKELLKEKKKDNGK
ncbi:MAG: tetratricopeptide repeat protein [Candidatus Omnitrophica bacterium]|nr:tetratricopeptide repeat protein [Candidatus Omnitrophota bacterium]